MNDAERLASLKQVAWEARDLALYLFYDRLERQLQQLRAVGYAAVLVYSDSRNDDHWHALYLALSDAGLLDAPDGESDGS